MREKLILIVICVFVLLASRVFATTYVVNSTEDRPDSDPFDGVCSAAVTGACTLRAAIMDANVAPGADTIVVPAGNYQITRALVEDAALGGDFDISEPVTILGAGSGSTIIDANGSVTNDRAFQIVTSNGLVRLSGFTLRNGKAGQTAGLYGGAIRAQAHNLSLGDLLIEENSAGEGGGMYFEGGTVSMKDVVLQKNAATDTGGGIRASNCVVQATNLVVHSNNALRGGGVRITGGGLTIIDGSISNHTVTDRGGGIFAEGLVLASVLTRTQIFSNSAPQGGGIYLKTSGDLNFTDSHVHHNHATATGGGGIQTNSPIHLLRTVVDSNTAVTNGGGIWIVDVIAAGTAIEESTISRNTAEFGAGVCYEQVAPPQSRNVAIRNSTIAANIASREGGGIYARGLANIFTYSATIAANSVFRPTGLNLRGGGVCLMDTAKVTAVNTIVADNTAGGINAPPRGDDIYTAATTTFQMPNGYNFVETTTNCTFSGTTFGCIFGQDPNFAPAGLTDNGGPTPTLALQASSAAINAGSNSAAPARDQRGYVRDGNADMGAYELGALELRITSIAKTGGDVVVGFDAVGGRTFRLERRDTHTDAWQQSAGAYDYQAPFTAPAQIVDYAGLDRPRALYRVRVLE
ncbi:MAG TPA: right-handed parallel beta-helix repeat-containing protein [Chthoniobacterales bacterium]|nr:right-handed parallel beta-helix repeat-containing protein [Chthoniobacterales bacterium]